MNFNFATIDTGAWAPSPVSMERLFEILELEQWRADLRQRAAIAIVKQEHGLLTVEEQDRLLEDGDLLKRAIKNWSSR